MKGLSPLKGSETDLCLELEIRTLILIYVLYVLVCGVQVMNESFVFLLLIEIRHYAELITVKFISVRLKVGYCFNGLFHFI